MSNRNANRLCDETSPYLRQHAHNPVDWHPWGDEALTAARTQDKPILLSIGYSACHWCHVMERESFEDPETAALMNDIFINIKVDREERPDIDAIYMDYVQLTTGSGGWPLTVFLTPDQTPFFGGTYFPPQGAYGRPGFREVLTRVARAYRELRGEIEEQAGQIRSALAGAARIDAEGGRLDESLLERAFQQMAQWFDDENGGFGRAPKFPNPMALGFMLRYHRRTGSHRALEIVDVSLQRMGRGGLYDQLGGGFHRYSVDAMWLAPHFEKMLYDNALLARLYTEAYQATGNRFYRDILEGTLGFLRSEMLHSEGGFFSALDADSEGEEGRYYLWSRAEVERVLGPDESALFCDYFDVTSAGNFEGANILHHKLELEGFARRLSMSADEVAKRLEASREKLLQARGARQRPALDDKVLCSWSALAATAFADAGFALKEPHLVQIASRTVEFLTSQLREDGRLLRVWKDGRARLEGYLEDYASTVEALITLHQVSGDLRWLDRAEELLRFQIELFSDQDSEDFYSTSSHQEPLIVRRKEYFDNATPCGNSTTCLNLLRLAELLGKDEYRERAAGMLRKVANAVVEQPLGFGFWLQALDFLTGPVDEIVLVGAAAEREALRDVVRTAYLPNKILVVAGPDCPPTQRIPLLQGKSSAVGQATAYVCRNYSCLRPVETASELDELLRNAREN